MEVIWDIVMGLFVEFLFLLVISLFCIYFDLMVIMYILILVYLFLFGICARKIIQLINMKI